MILFFLIYLGSIHRSKMFHRELLNSSGAYIDYDVFIDEIPNRNYHSGKSLRISILPIRLVLGSGIVKKNGKKKFVGDIVNCQICVYFNLDYEYLAYLMKKAIMNKMVEFNVNESGDVLICKMNIIENFLPYVVRCERV